MLEEFDRLGCSVDVYFRSGGEKLAKICHAQPNACFPIPFRLWAGDLESTFRQWKWFLKYRGRKATKVLNSRNYDFTIGLNPEGVVAAHRYWRRTRTPFIYLSFEMFFRQELRSRGLLQFKEQEIAAAKDASFVISQDNWRARLLCDECSIPHNQIELLPVAPNGRQPIDRTNYLREKLGISDKKIIVLHAGSFRYFTCADEITSSLSKWPEDFILVVNTSYSKNETNPFVNRLRLSAKGRAFILQGGISPAELNQLVRSADIGLAFYQPNQRVGHHLWDIFGGLNLKTIGLSSGKFSTFAQNGIPIVCGGNPVLKQFLGDYHFGAYVDDFSELPSCLSQVALARASLGMGARKFFEEHLDFDRYWPRIWKRILGLSKVGH
jgi:hypothetical protein